MKYEKIKQEMTQPSSQNYNLPETWEKGLIKKESLYVLAETLREKIYDQLAFKASKRFLIGGLREALRDIYKQSGVKVNEPKDCESYITRWDN